MWCACVRCNHSQTKLHQKKKLRSISTWKLVQPVLYVNLTITSQSPQGKVKWTLRLWAQQWQCPQIITCLNQFSYLWLSMFHNPYCESTHCVQTKQKLKKIAVQWKSWQAWVWCLDWKITLEKLKLGGLHHKYLHVNYHWRILYPRTCFDCEYLLIANCQFFLCFAINRFANTMTWYGVDLCTYWIHNLPDMPKMQYHKSKYM